MDPCINGCGSFGSPEKGNMCAACYEPLENFCKLIGRDITTQSPSTCSCEEPGNKGKRCKICSKKVGVIGFTCLCGDLFCGKHRYPEEHSCTVDYKGIDRQLLQEQNPICRADKLSLRF